MVAEGDDSISESNIVADNIDETIQPTAETRE